MCQFFSCIEIFLTYLQVLKPQTIQGGGRNKFAPLDCPYAPFSIPAWSAALQAVDRSSPRLIEPSKTYAKYGHYTFPNPGLFTHPATAAKYIESWLRIRDIWFMRLEQEPSLAMSSQAWRTLLSMDTNTSEKSGTKAALRRQIPLGRLFGRTRSISQECYHPRTLFDRFSGSCMRLISFMNCFHWTVGLVQI